jgi:ferredoxin-NADP reductase
MARTTLPGRLVWRAARVVERTTETPHAATLVLDVPDWPGHRPGQHLDVRLTAEDGYQAVRSYSIATPDDGERVAITVELLDDGEVSPYLVEDVQLDDQFEVLGPIGGHFVWETSDGGPLLLIAGGSGIVPLMAMLRHRGAVGSEIPTRLLYSARSDAELIYRSELDARAVSGPGLGLFYTLTRQQPPGWDGYARRVDRAMLAEIVWPAVDAPRIYVCGPTAFVETVADYLTALGHDPLTIKTERFGPTGG